MVPGKGQIVGGKYRLLRPIARGGMGSVWRARHLELDTELALKLIRDDAGTGSNAEDVERFRREARASARLRSDHVVRVLDYGVDEGCPYLAMELLEGEDLSLLLKTEGRLSPHVALPLLEQAAAGLAVAHEAGLIHRDIKPSNLFVETTSAGDRVKLLDFGVVKDLSQHDAAATGGVVWGSPGYLSPEQARGAPIDGRSDLWSLSSVAYEMLTGRAAFRGETSADLIVRLCTEAPERPSSLVPELPRSLDAFFQRAFSLEPDQRHQNCTAWTASLSEALDVPLTEKRRASQRSLSDLSDTGGRDTATRPMAPEKPIAGRDSVTAPLHADLPTAPQSSTDQDGASSMLTPGGRLPRLLFITALIALALLLYAVLKSRPPEFPSQPAERSKADANASEAANPAPPKTKPSPEQVWPADSTDRATPHDAADEKMKVATPPRPPARPSPSSTAAPRPSATPTSAPASEKHSPSTKSAPPSGSETDALFGLPVNQ